MEAVIEFIDEAVILYTILVICGVQLGIHSGRLMQGVSGEDLDRVVLNSLCFLVILFGTIYLLINR